MPHLWPIVTEPGTPLGRADASGASVDSRLQAVADSPGDAAQAGTPLSERTAVLAIGSNACLAQMHHKYIRATDRRTYVQVPAAVRGLDVGYASLVAGYGSVPATAVPSEGTAMIAVQFLDHEFVRQLDATETGYERLTFTPADGVTVKLPTGRVLDSVDVYVAAGGYLGAIGQPLLMGSGGGRVDQATMMARLLGSDPSSMRAVADAWVNVPADPFDVADGGELTRRLRDAIRASGLVQTNPFLP